MGKWDDNYHKGLKDELCEPIRRLERFELSVLEKTSQQRLDERRRWLSKKTEGPVMLFVCYGGLFALLLAFGGEGLWPLVVVVAVFLLWRSLYPSTNLSRDLKGRAQALDEVLVGEAREMWVRLRLEADVAAEKIAEVRRAEKRDFAQHSLDSRNGPAWRVLRAEIIQRDNERCVMCGWPDGFLRKRRRLHVHHITPVVDGGGHDEENLVTLCDICHRKEHARLNKGGAPEDFRV